MGNYLHKKFKISVWALFCICFISCKKYLDTKQDKKLIIPTTLKELQGLLDLSVLYSDFPNAGGIGDDNCYYTFVDWQSLDFESRNNYIWNKEVDLVEDWQTAYNRILHSNVVLDAIDALQDPGSTPEQRSTVKGDALFYRALNFYELAQVFSPQYSSESASTNYGIPLKSSPDVGDPTVRSTVQQTYDRIIDDLRLAAGLLPLVASPKTRPSKVASWALLARTFLVMQEYDSAAKYSDLCLQEYDPLLDYNSISYNDPLPFQSFNDEVIFHANSRFNYSFAMQKVDSVLYGTYDNNDLRKPAFFSDNFDGTFSPKGNYSGFDHLTPFAGIATDEMYLVRAECRARKGLVDESMDVLNKLLQKRWLSGSFIPFNASNASEALNIILLERRKELVFRSSLRWSDLRRLNLYTEHSTIIKRVLDGQNYELIPGDKRYTFLIPQSVINISGIEQNQR